MWFLLCNSNFWLDCVWHIHCKALARQFLPRWFSSVHSPLLMVFIIANIWDKSKSSIVHKGSFLYHFVWHAPYHICTTFMTRTALIVLIPTSMLESILFRISFLLRFKSRFVTISSHKELHSHQQLPFESHKSRVHRPIPYVLWTRWSFSYMVLGHIVKPLNVISPTRVRR